MPPKQHTTDSINQVPHPDNPLYNLEIKVYETGNNRHPNRLNTDEGCEDNSLNDDWGDDNWHPNESL